MRRVQAEEAARRPVEPVVEIITVDQAAERLRERITIEAARLSYRQNCESMQRVHVSPAMGKRKVASVTTRDVERLAGAMLAKCASPKTIRNVMTFLHRSSPWPFGTGGRRRTPSPMRRGRADAARATPIRTCSS
jgi:hypothetical protein